MVPAKVVRDMNILEIIVLTSAFIIVMACSLQALTFGAMFSGARRTLMGLVVTALSVLGLMLLKPNQGGAEEGPSPSGSPLLNGILLPYAAMALAMVGTVLIAAFLRLMRPCDNKPEKHEGQQDNQESIGPDHVRLFGDEPDDRTRR